MKKHFSIFIFALIFALVSCSNAPKGNVYFSLIGDDIPARSIDGDIDYHAYSVGVKVLNNPNYFTKEDFLMSKNWSTSYFDRIDYVSSGMCFELWYFTFNDEEKNITDKVGTVKDLVDGQTYDFIVGYACCDNQYLYRVSKLSDEDKNESLFIPFTYDSTKDTYIDIKFDIKEDNSCVFSYFIDGEEYIIGE